MQEAIRLFHQKLSTAGIRNCILCHPRNPYTREHGLQPWQKKVLVHELRAVGCTIAEIRILLGIEEKRSIPTIIEFSDEEIVEGEWYIHGCVQVSDIIEELQKRFLRGSVG